ncbi:MAG: P-loop NTPase fold protein [Lacibacter sp.]
MELFRPDKPVSVEKEDWFQRYTFAKRIAAIVTNSHYPKSLVVGIYGKWGEGKTSVLNFIQNEIASSAVIVNFNPWLFNDQKQLLKSFFEAMADAVGRKLKSKNERIADIFTDYADSIGTLAEIWMPSGIFSLGKKITEKLKKDSIEDLKRKVDEIIIEANINFVVFIDDIDRLDAAEIQSVFKLVKLVGDFPRTSYILSFDDDMIAAALGPKYADGDKKAGYNFLEKIIQIPLHLPKAQSKQLRDYTLHLLNESLKGIDVVIEKKSIDEFIGNFDETFADAIDNPRFGVRLANSIGFSIPLLDGEANVSDLMTIEAIKTFFPQLYLFIRNNSSYFLTAFSSEERHYGVPSGMGKSEMKMAIDDHLKTYPVQQKEKIQLMLMGLFPQLKTIYQSYVFHEYSFMEWHRKKKICSPQYFYRYFSYVVQKGDISDIFFTELLNGLDTLSLPELKIKFRQRFEMVSVSDLIFKLRNWERNFPPEEAIPLARVLASLGDKFADHDQEFLTASTFGIAAYFIGGLIKNLPADKRLNTALDIMNDAQPLSFCLQIEQFLTDSERHVLDESRLSLDDIAGIRKIIVDRFKDQMQDNNVFDITEEPYLQLIVYWWFKYGNIEELKKYIKVEMEKDAVFSFNLLKAFIPTITTFSFDRDGTKSIKSDFSVNTYADLSQIIDPVLLLQNMESVFGEISPSDKIPASRTALSDITIRSVFKKVHLQATSGEITLPAPWSSSIDILSEG